jgi:hypothetical protein
VEHVVSELVVSNSELFIISIITSVVDNKLGVSISVEMLNEDIMPSFIKVYDMFSSSASVLAPVINDNLTINSDS